MRLSIIILLIGMLLTLGCQGREFTNQPIHINPNMDMQPKYLPQSESGFFVDGAAMRTAPEGAVARGQLRSESQFYLGIDPVSGEPIQNSPVQVTGQQAEYGKERFNIYCSRCHGLDGNGKGVVIEKGFMPPPDFHSDKVKSFSDGYIFNVITNGVRNMPSHAAQIPPEERWLILNRVRELQKNPVTVPQETTGGDKGGI